MTNLMRLLTATAALLVATPAAAVSIEGIATGDPSQFFFDAFEDDDAAVFSIDPGPPAATSLSVLRNVEDPIIGFDQVVLMTASGAAFDFAPGGDISATLEVTFDLEDAFSDFVDVTIAFDSPVDDIFDIAGSESAFLSVANVAGPPAVIPLPTSASLLLGALALAGLMRARR